MVINVVKEEERGCITLNSLSGNGVWWDTKHSSDCILVYILENTIGHVVEKAKKSKKWLKVCDNVVF